MTGVATRTDFTQDEVKEDKILDNIDDLSVGDNIEDLARLVPLGDTLSNDTSSDDSLSAAFSSSSSSDKPSPLVQFDDSNKNTTNYCILQVTNYDR